MGRNAPPSSSSSSSWRSWRDRDQQPHQQPRQKGGMGTTVAQRGAWGRSGSSGSDGGGGDDGGQWRRGEELPTLPAGSTSNKGVRWGQSRPSSSSSSGRPANASTSAIDGNRTAAAPPPAAAKGAANGTAAHATPRPGGYAGALLGAASPPQPDAPPAAAAAAEARKTNTNDQTRHPGSGGGGGGGGVSEHRPTPTPKNAWGLPPPPPHREATDESSRPMQNQNQTQNQSQNQLKGPTPGGAMQQQQKQSSGSTNNSGRSSLAQAAQTMTTTTTTTTKRKNQQGGSSLSTTGPGQLPTILRRQPQGQPQPQPKERQEAPEVGAWGRASPPTTSSSSSNATQPAAAAAAAAPAQAVTAEAAAAGPAKKSKGNKKKSNTSSNSGSKHRPSENLGTLGSLVDFGKKGAGASARTKSKAGGTGGNNNKSAGRATPVTTTTTSAAKSADSNNLDQSDFPSLLADFPSLPGVAASSAAAGPPRSASVGKRRGPPPSEAAAAAGANWSPPSSSSSSSRPQKITKTARGGVAVDRTGVGKGVGAGGAGGAIPGGSTKQKPGDKKKSKVPPPAHVANMLKPPLSKKQHSSRGGGGRGRDDAMAMMAEPSSHHASSMIATRDGQVLTDKRGRQRLGPRKKRLTTLKKRVLQERLRMWREANPGAADDAESAKEQPQQASMEGVQSTGTPGAPAAHDLLENARSQASFCSVCLSNFVQPDELEDDDEYEEILSDLGNLAEKVGAVSDVYVPRSVEDAGGGEDDPPPPTEDAIGLAFVRFVSPDDALAAVACWDGITIGGCKVVATAVVDETDGPPTQLEQWQCLMLLHDPKADSNLAMKQVGAGAVIDNAAGGESSAGDQSISTVILDNILTEDDFEDEDCLAESTDDIRALVEQFGNVSDVEVHVDGDRKGQVYVKYRGGDLVGTKAVGLMHGMVICGQKVTAKLDGQEMGSVAEQSAHDQGILVLDNILTEDDFEDEDCLEESKDDIATLLQKFGGVSDMQIHLNGAERGQVHVRFDGGEGITSKAAKETDGTVIGGQIVSAKVLGSNDNNDVAKETESKELGLKVITDRADGATSNVEMESTPDPPPPLYSGNKVIPEQYAQCKRVPKVPNPGVPRAYASKIDDESVVPLIDEMLGELMRLQIRSKDDKNARARRRLVMGLREVSRGIRAHKVKMVVMANNLDEYGAIDAKLQEILDQADAEDVPVLFELSKRRLGKSLGKSIKVAVVGIQNADGAHEPFKKLKKLIATAPRKQLAA